eukprot:TRINITY_DN6825_c0_g1_i1.p3 TRINITY_DN6825_c0_g1~~TRINITY_DN6825_c0_g1_i1.p3  ORF type:complete len:117 (+),score=16.19 TRINITY_DN6825_c0_g1_i1:130-480(+)
MAGGRIIQIKNPTDWKNKLQDAQDKQETIIVDFTAQWCGPCNMIAPKFEQFSEEYDDIVFLKVDVDEVIDVASECGISAMPTFHIIQNGKKVDELLGASEDKLREMIQKYSKKQTV